jgi:hypothetical protein
MLHPMKKNAFFFVLNVISITALLTLYGLIVRGTLSGIMGTPILLIEFVFLKMNIDFKSIIEKKNGFHWIIGAGFTICGLAGYLLLMQAATRAKQAARG